MGGGRAEMLPVMPLQDGDAAQCRMILPQFDSRLDRPVDAVCKEALERRHDTAKAHIQLIKLPDQLYSIYNSSIIVYKCNKGLIR